MGNVEKEPKALNGLLRQRLRLQAYRRSSVILPKAYANQISRAVVLESG